MNIFENETILKIIEKLNNDVEENKELKKDVEMFEYALLRLQNDILNGKKEYTLVSTNFCYEFHHFFHKVLDMYGLDEVEHEESKWYESKIQKKEKINI